MSKIITKGAVTPKKVLTKKQSENFKRAKKNYNARVSYAVNKWRNKTGLDLSYETLARTQVIPIKMHKKASDIKNASEYQNLMKIMKQDKTKKYRKERGRAIRNNLVYVIENAYYPSPEQDAEIKRLIGKMSDEDIIKFRLTNTTMVTDYFEAYKSNMYGGGIADADKYTDDMEAVMQSLRDASSGTGHYRLR